MIRAIFIALVAAQLSGGKIAAAELRAEQSGSLVIPTGLNQANCRGLLEQVTLGLIAMKPNVSITGSSCEKFMDGAAIVIRFDLGTNRGISKALVPTVEFVDFEEHQPITYEWEEFEPRELQDTRLSLNAEGAIVSESFLYTKFFGHRVETVGTINEYTSQEDVDRMVPTVFRLTDSKSKEVVGSKLITTLKGFRLVSVFLSDLEKNPF